MTSHFIEHNVNQTRREILKAGSMMGLLAALVASGVLTAETAQAAWEKNAFEAKNLKDSLAALGAVKTSESADIILNIPDIAENGAVVPMGVTTSLPKVESIAILIEKNPFPLAAQFMIPAGTETSVQTRCKMSQTSNVYGLVKANGQFYMVAKEVKVTLGGCGG